MSESEIALIFGYLEGKLKSKRRVRWAEQVQTQTGTRTLQGDGVTLRLEQLTQSGKCCHQTEQAKGSLKRTIVSRAIWKCHRFSSTNTLITVNKQWSIFSEVFRHFRRTPSLSAKKPTNRVLEQTLCEARSIGSNGSESAKVNRSSSWSSMMMLHRSLTTALTNPWTHTYTQNERDS